jgi:hypothetical protein
MDFKKLRKDFGCKPCYVKLKRLSDKKIQKIKQKLKDAAKAQLLLRKERAEKLKKEELSRKKKFEELARKRKRVVIESSSDDEVTVVKKPVSSAAEHPGTKITAVLKKVDNIPKMSGLSSSNAMKSESCIKKTEAPVPSTTVRKRRASSSDSDEPDGGRAERLAQEREKLEERRKAIIRQRVAQSSKEPVPQDLLASILPAESSLPASTGATVSTLTKTAPGGTEEPPAKRMKFDQPLTSAAQEENADDSKQNRHEAGQIDEEEYRPVSPILTVEHHLLSIVKQEEAKPKYELKSYKPEDAEEDKDINNPEWDIWRMIKNDTER